MKKFFTLFLVSFTMLSFSSMQGLEDVVAALKNNNASQMALYFDNTVDITLPEKSNSYSKSQAEVILRDFLSNNPVKSFEKLHKGDNSGSEYCIGKLVTKNRVYRTTIFMKQKGDKQFLQEIRFENM
jgi:Domain of unknown function (DUF4783)